MTFLQSLCTTKCILHDDDWILINRLDKIVGLPDLAVEQFPSAFNRELTSKVLESRHSGCILSSFQNSLAHLAALNIHSGLIQKRRKIKAGFLQPPNTIPAGLSALRTSQFSFHQWRIIRYPKISWLWPRAFLNGFLCSFRNSIMAAPPLNWPPSLYCPYLSFLLPIAFETCSKGLLHLVPFPLPTGHLICCRLQQHLQLEVWPCPRSWFTPSRWVITSAKVPKWQTWHNQLFLH